MTDMLFNNASIIMSFIVAGFVLVWLFFAYYTHKVTSGIKKSLGSEYYMLPNKWPGSDNPDTRKAIKESPELSRFYKLKIRLFVVLLGYIFIIIAPFMGFIYYHAK